jgi:hypothetical protein
MEVWERHARTRAITRDTVSPGNRAIRGGHDASRDVARVVSAVSVLFPSCSCRSKTVPRRCSQGRRCNGRRRICPTRSGYNVTLVVADEVLVDGHRSYQGTARRKPLLRLVMPCDLVPRADLRRPAAPVGAEPSAVLVLTDVGVAGVVGRAIGLKAVECRRRPPASGFLAAAANLGGKRWQRTAKVPPIWAVLAAVRFATGCHRLRPPCSISAP